MTTRDCKNCSWFVDRPKNAYEVKILRSYQNIIIDTRFCTLGGCDGSRFIDRNREVRNDNVRENKSRDR